MKIEHFKLTHNEFTSLGNTELFGTLLKNHFKLQTENSDGMEGIHKCVDFLEQHATGLWCHSNVGLGTHAFYFECAMDKANCLEYLHQILTA